MSLQHTISRNEATFVIMSDFWVRFDYLFEYLNKEQTQIQNREETLEYLQSIYKMAND